MRSLSLLTLICLFLALPAANAMLPHWEELPIRIRLLTNKEVYQPGEDVKIELQAINTSDAEISLTFPDGHQQDYSIDGRYLWSADKGFIEALTHVEIPPGGTYSWHFVHTSKDYFLTPGKHVIVGIVVGYGHSEPVPILVAERTDLQITVSSDKEVYSVGEEVPIHVTAKNVSESDIILRFPTGRQAGYCIDERYFRYDGSDLTDVSSEILLKPGDSHTWDFVHDPNEYPLTPGTHIIKGIVAGYGHSEPIKIAVTSGLEVTVETDKLEYALDEDVQILVTATNKSLEPITLKFGSSHQASYVIDGVYDWSKNHPALEVLTELTLQPGESWTWDPFVHKPEDYGLLPGRHSIVGVVIGYAKSEPAGIFVVGEQPGIAVSVSTNKEVYGLDEPVTINVTATNNSERPATLRFPTLHQADYEIDGAYLWSRGKLFLPIPVSFTIPGGAQVTWEFVHRPGEYRLLPGEHSIVGIVVGYGKSDPLTIVVKEEHPPEVTARGLLAYVVPDNSLPDTGGELRGYFVLYTRDPHEVYVLFPGAIDLAPHLNMTVEVTGNYVYTLIPLPVPGIPLAVHTIRDILSVKVETDKAEYYQSEDIRITVIARNLTEQTFDLYFEGVVAKIDDIIVPPEGPEPLFPIPFPIQIPPKGTQEWKFVYHGSLNPLPPGEHHVSGEVLAYGKSKNLPIKVIEKPSEKIVAEGIVDRLPEDPRMDGMMMLPRYVLVDRATGQYQYILRNPAIDFGQYLAQFVEVVGVLSNGIEPEPLNSLPEIAVPELFVLRIRRLLAVAVSTDKIAYALAQETVPPDLIHVYVTAKNCTPEEMILTFPSGDQAYYQISSNTSDSSLKQGVPESADNVVIPPYGLHVWQFETSTEGLPEGDYTVFGGVYGYGQAKPVTISVKKDPPPIITAEGIVEQFWWWKWVEPPIVVEPDPTLWPWVWPCRYVLFDPVEKKISYFLSSHRVELHWYLGRYVRVTGYVMPEVLPMEKLQAGAGSNPGDDGETDPPIPPIIPWIPAERLDVASALPIDKPLPDDNGDGVRDSWEIVSGLIGAGGEQDSDKDGMPNSWECMAGTDPLDPSSVAQVKVEANPAGMVILRWATVPGRTYSVYCADGLSGGELGWRLLIGGIEGTGAEFTWTDDGASDVAPSNTAGLKSRFYRVEVQ